jgi:hypothetical protein
MKTTATVLLAAFVLLASACSTYVPTIGMEEKDFLKNTVSYDLVYLQGNVKAYRAGGSYHYFRDGLLVKVVPELLTPDKV